MKLGCIADDFTGATDLANELTARGLRTVLLLGIPQAGVRPEADAIVIALKSRSIEASEAVAQSIAALDWLRGLGCARFYFKYCSTFDSTEKGNIGPVIEALRTALGVNAVIACPAFPSAARTVYQGHLFVGDRLLSETGLRDHPLNPMRDPDLVRVLQRQMEGRVDLLAWEDVAADRVDQRMRAFQDEGIAAVVADAISEEDLRRLGAYCTTVPLSSGGSGLAAGIARSIAGANATRISAAVQGAKSGRRVILAGSCSEATRCQIAAAREIYPTLRLALGQGQTIQNVVSEAHRWVAAQAADRPLLIYSSASPEEVEAQRSRWNGDSGAAFEAILSELAWLLLDEGLSALIVAGGETSGAVVNRLGLTQLQIGPEIDPGVPWTIASCPNASDLPIVLKSGNFGRDTFFLEAWDYLA